MDGYQQLKSFDVGYGLVPK